MKKTFRLFSILIVFSFIMGACAPAAAPVQEVQDTTIILKDGLDREVTLDAPAQKIVSLAPSITEILFTLGADEQVIGRDDFSDYPVDEISNISTVGGTTGYNLEEIANLEPDLILAAGIISPEEVKAIEDLGLTVFMVSNPTTMEEMFISLETIARLTGYEAEAQELISSLDERVEAVETAVASTEEKPAVFIELDGTDATKPWTTGPGTFQDMLIQMAGGENVGAALEGAWGQISQEELIVQNPDYIFLDQVWGAMPEDIGRRPGWEEINAVANEDIYSVDFNILSRPGPRLVDGLEMLAQQIHPELFE